MQKDICFWSVGDGDYAWMMQSLVDSFHRVGMEGDFHVFTDKKIQGAINHLIKPFDKRGFLFKFSFLENEVANWNYRYFVHLDADSIFIRKPPLLLELMKDSPLHFFFESDCTLASKRDNWWNCPLTEYVRLMRDCGVTSKKIYNLNSGLFILKKEAIAIAVTLAKDFWDYALKEGYYFPDEPPWAYAMHMLCDLPEKHLLRDYFNVWCSDWSGEWAEKVPTDEPWIFRDYFNYEPYLVNPAIIHAIKSKEALVSHAKNHIN